MTGGRSACAELVADEHGFIYGPGSLRAVPLDETEIEVPVVDSLLLTLPKDVRDKDAVKLDKTLKVRDLGRPMRDFDFFLGDG
jgi:hypothetical protein